MKTMKTNATKIKKVTKNVANNGNVSPLISLVQNVYKNVRLDRLIPHPKQPSERTTKSYCLDLLRIIKETRRFDPLILIEIPNKPGYYYIVNGNRRALVAKWLGYTELQCCILPKGTDPTTVWIEANSGTRAVTGSQVLTSLTVPGTSARERDAMLSVMVKHKSRQVGHIQTMIKILGWSTVKRLGQHGASPNRVTRLNQLVKFGRMLGFSKVNHPEEQRKILLWFYEFDMYRAVGDSVQFFDKRGVGRRLLTEIFSCIEKNEPYQLKDHLISTKS